MKTNENQKSTNHQPAAQKPFFGATPDHPFFSAESAASTPFFQPKAISPSAIQAKAATSEAEGINQPLVQQMPAFESELSANGEVHRKLMNSSASPIQAKLSIGEPGDKYEQEADRVASQVVEQINAPVSAQSAQGETLQRQEEPEEELQAKPEITTLQRMEEKPEELQAKSTLQRQEAIAAGEASTDLTSAINSARGSGQPLEASMQQSMGQAMGADFSGVRVHTDSQSDQLNQSIQAKAFTTGQDVFFRQGAYDPGSRGGQELIAHELTHVVQQKEGRVKPTIQAKGVGINDNVGLEQEADVMGRKALQMRRDAPTIVKSALSNSVFPQMSVSTVGVLPIQCYRDWKELYKTGWKYSGGTMATHGNLGGLWHASVFRVDKDGKSKADGLFSHGFHLTMEGDGPGPLPHVFFDDKGVYQANMTTDHNQTAAYKLLVGDAVLANDIDNAKALSGQALAFLGPEIEEDQRTAMEEAEAQKKVAAKEDEEQALQVAVAKLAAEEAAAAAQPEDEDASLDWLLKDAGFTGVLTSYRNQLKGYLVGDGNENAITFVGLIPLAKWYRQGKKANWLINESTALYTGWNKAPAVINWINYANSKDTRKRGLSKTGIPSEFRYLSFNGYASYRLHPNAMKPKKV